MLKQKMKSAKIKSEFKSKVLKNLNGSSLKAVLKKADMKYSSSNTEVELRRKISGQKKISVFNLLKAANIENGHILTETKRLSKINIQLRTFKWKSYGVTVDAAELDWFDSHGGGYTQTFDEFIKAGPKNLWIDRSMPEKTRIALYKALGEEAPKIPKRSDLVKKIKDLFAKWKKKYGKGSANCKVCSTIPKYTYSRYGMSHGEHIDENTLPGSREKFLKLISFYGGLLLICTDCGQMYHNWFESDKDVWEDEESEMLQKMSHVQMRNYVIRRVKEYRQYKTYK